MRDWKGNEYAWPTRNANERRVHPRVQVGFPVELRESNEPFPGVASDVSLGGLRIEVPRHVSADAKLQLSFALAVTDRQGGQVEHRFDARASVVRCTPSANQAEGGSDHQLSVRFDEEDRERERIIGVFMLQTLLFVPDATLR